MKTLSFEKSSRLDKNEQKNENVSNIVESPSIIILSNDQELRKQLEIPTIVIEKGDEPIETSDTQNSNNNNSKNQINENRVSYARKLFGLLSKTISHNSDQESQNKLVVKFDNSNKDADQQTEHQPGENSNQNTLKIEENNTTNANLSVESPADSSNQVVLRKPLSRTTSLINHLSLNYSYYNQNIIQLLNENISRTLNSNETALQKFESIFGPALVIKLVIDNSKNIKEPTCTTSVEQNQTTQIREMSDPTTITTQNSSSISSRYGQK